MKFTFPGRDPGISKAGNTGFHFVTVMLLIFMFIGFIQLTQSTQMQAIKQQNELLKVEITELQKKQRIQQQDIDLIEKILIQQAKP